MAAAGGALGTGTAIQLGDANTGSNPAQLFISSGNTFSQNITVNAANATLGSADDSNSVFGGTVTLNSSLTIASQSVSPGNALTFAGNILHGSGANSVTLTGPGNVVFLGNATYQGATTVNGGYLTVGATGSLPSTTTLNINNASTVEFDNPAQTLAVLNGSAQSTLNLFNLSGTTLTVGAGSFAGTINDNMNIASLVKNTTGTLYLTGPGVNTYYGPTTVTAGALLYGSVSNVSAAAGPGSITVGTSGAVGLYQASGLPGLLPSINAASNGTLVVTPATAGDTVNLASSSLNLLSLGALDNETYTGTLTPFGANYRLGGGGGTLTYPSAMTGSLGLVANGPPTGGEVILTSTANTFSGGTTISRGTLEVGNGSFAGSLPGSSVVNNGTLILDPPATTSLSVSGAISSNGNLVMAGAGLATLTASNTYSGPTLISAGTLQLGNGGGTGTLNTASTITDNGTLAFNNSGTLTQGTNFSSAAITGSGGITQLGPGTLVLNNTGNSFTGNVVVSGGTLNANGNFASVNSPMTSALGNPQLAMRSITVGNGGTLQFSIGNVLGGGGSTVQTPLIIQAGGLVTNAVNDVQSIGPLTLSGGTLTGIGGANAGYLTYSFGTNGVVNVNGGANSLITLTGAGNGFQGINLVPNTTFNIAAQSSLTINNMPLANADNSFAAGTTGGLTLTGSGLLTLSTTSVANFSTFSGNVNITGGTLALFTAGGVYANSTTRLRARQYVPGHPHRHGRPGRRARISLRQHDWRQRFDRRDADQYQRRLGHQRCCEQCQQHHAGAAGSQRRHAGHGGRQQLGLPDVHVRRQYDRGERGRDRQREFLHHADLQRDRFDRRRRRGRLPTGDQQHL